MSDEQTKKLGQTPSQTVGPFFAYGLTPAQYGYDLAPIADSAMARPDTDGTRIRMEGRVFDGEWLAHEALKLPDLRADGVPQGFFSFTYDITQLKRARTKNIDSATSIHQEKVSAIRTKYADRIARTRAYYSSVIKRVKAAWKTIYADDIAAAKSQRTKQFQLVTNLRNRGAGYIDQMPEAPTCRAVDAAVC